MTFQHSIDQIAETLNEAKMARRGGVLLVGAGTSTKAGIPDGAGFSNIIQSRFPEAARQAVRKDYHTLTALLSPAQKACLHAEHVENAAINWAPIAIALLMREGFVDRVLTTNFDSLILRACGLLGFSPTVYDCAVSQLQEGSLMPDKLVVHLHGQCIGAAPLHNPEGYQALAQSTKPLFREAGEERPWIVVGYGGTRDPVFEHLKKIQYFENGLYWVSGQNGKPPEHVETGLMGKDKGVYYTEGPDADFFLVSLAQKLNLFPPDFIAQPFTHLDKLVRSITPFPLSGQGEEIDLSDSLHHQTQLAIEQFETAEEGSPQAEDLVLPTMGSEWRNHNAILTAQRALLAGNTEEILKTKPQYEKTRSPELGRFLLWAYLEQGKDLMDQAGSREGVDASLLLERAAAKFQSACHIQPDHPWAQYHLGRARMEQAKGESGENALEMFSTAAVLFEKVVQADPNHPAAYHAWASSLLEASKGTEGEQAESLLMEAIEKFKTGSEMRPDSADPLCGWGNALVRRSELNHGNESVHLLTGALEKFKLAHGAEADHHGTLTSWAHALGKLAEKTSGENADRFYKEAGKKFQAALELQPNHPPTYARWGDLLRKQASLHEGEEAGTLYVQAAEKFEAALKRQPQMLEALCGLGQVQYARGMGETGETAHEFLTEAIDNFRSALAILPGHCPTLNAWGKALFRLGQRAEESGADDYFAEAAEKFDSVLAIEPDNYEAFNNWGRLFLHLAHKHPEEESSLLTQAAEKFRAALAFKPDDPDALYNWGNTLSRMALAADLPDSEKLYNQALEKYQAALAIRPAYPLAYYNWGLLLMDRAHKRKGKNTDVLLSMAAEHFVSALELKPDLVEAHLQLGLVLIEQGKNKKGINVHPFLASAKDSLSKAEELRPGCARYHLARLMALLANETQCREYLESGFEQGTLPDLESLLSEPDLVSFHNSKWFKTLLSKMETRETSAKPS